MKIFIDGDGCPVTDIVIKTAKKYDIPVVLICDTAHFGNRDDCETVIVSKGADSVDFTLINKACPGDIAVTQDYGLGAMCLAKSIYAINQNGFLYTDKNIDSMLLRRHIGKEIAKRGGRGARIRKRRYEDDIHFEECLVELIDKLLK